MLHNYAYIQTKCINIYAKAVVLVINTYEYADKYSDTAVMPSFCRY